ncbi:hypothetical protein BCV70DRAFT_236347, partial [Testicularia cyperi]
MDRSASGVCWHAAFPKARSAGPLRRDKSSPPFSLAPYAACTSPLSSLVARVSGSCASAPHTRTWFTCAPQMYDQPVSMIAVRPYPLFVVSRLVHLPDSPPSCYHCPPFVPNFRLVPIATPNHPAACSSSIFSTSRNQA